MFILYGHTKCLSAVYHRTVNLGKYALGLISIHRAFSPKFFGNGAGGGGVGVGAYTRMDVCVSNQAVVKTVKCCLSTPKPQSSRTNLRVVEQFLKFDCTYFDHF